MGKGDDTAGNYLFCDPVLFYVIEFACTKSKKPEKPVLLLSRTCYGFYLDFRCRLGIKKNLVNTKKFSPIAKLHFSIQNT